MVNTAPGRSVRLAAAIVPPSASTKPRQIASPRPVPARRRSPVGSPVELLEHARDVPRREARPLVGDREHDRVAAPAALERDGRARRGVLGGVVEQVDEHLLDNAAKYAPPGSTVTLEGRRCGDAVALTVADEGPGLARGDVAHVFEKFYRGADAGDRRRAGTGLGLAICRGFAEALDGTIAAANRTDRPGAVFTITFPRATFAATPREEAPP